MRAFHWDAEDFDPVTWAAFPGLGASWRVSSLIRLKAEATPLLLRGTENGKTWLLLYGARFGGEHFFGDLDFALPLLQRGLVWYSYMPLGLPLLSFGYRW